MSFLRNQVFKRYMVCLAVIGHSVMLDVNGCLT